MEELGALEKRGGKDDRNSDSMDEVGKGSKKQDKKGCFSFFGHPTVRSRLEGGIIK